MCGPHHCPGRGTSAPDSEIVCKLLQLRQNASILEQGCAGFSPGSANRCDQFTHHPGRTSSPLRPSLSFRYTQDFITTTTELKFWYPQRNGHACFRRKCNSNAHRGVSQRGGAGGSENIQIPPIDAKCCRPHKLLYRLSRRPSHYWPPISVQQRGQAVFFPRLSRVCRIHTDDDVNTDGVWRALFPSCVPIRGQEALPSSILLRPSGTGVFWRVAGVSRQRALNKRNSIQS